jgi:hypothetical protein
VKLIDNANQWHRLWSIRFAILSALFGSITTAYLALPPDWLPYIPGWAKLLLAAGSMLTAGAASAARVVRQDALKPDDTDSAGA